MPDIVLTKQQIKRGKTSQLKEGMAEIRNREDEAIATLEHEGMHAETAFIEHTTTAISWSINCERMTSTR